MVKTTPSVKSADDFELTKGFTVGDYKRLEAAGDVKEIAKFIRNRFSGRYLEPLLSVPKEKKSGFSMLAICCLMIEALEAFRQGWPNSDGKSEAAFRDFFKNFDQFAQLRGHEAAFYEHVRCGILHQAETTNGWRIVRGDGKSVFDPPTLTIDANGFLAALKASFETYCELLEKSPWAGNEWLSARTKLKAICDNCVHIPGFTKKAKRPKSAVKPATK